MRLGRFGMDNALALNSYLGKKVFVTGHSGFKGTWLCTWLKMLGANVKGYSLPNDILNKNKLEKEILTFKPDIIFHLAAQPLVIRSYKEPLLTYQTNVMGTLNVLEAARKCKSVKAFVNVTTDKVYENKENGKAYKENDKLGGYDMYSSSKACVEILSDSYRKSFLQDTFLLATARSGNCIGGGDWSENRIVPDCIRSLVAGTPIEIRNPVSVRPWQFVLEPIYGYLLLGEKLLQGDKEFASSFNFGPNRNSCITVMELAEKITDFYGYSPNVIASEVRQSRKNNHHEANLLMLNNGKAKKMLNWKPKYSIDKAIEKTVEFYLHYNYCKSKNLTKNTLKFMLTQIEEYSNA